VVSGSGPRIDSSSRLSAIVDSDKPVILDDGDGGAEEFRLVLEGVSGMCNDSVGV
jgi:hypothetical protein